MARMTRSVLVVPLFLVALLWVLQVGTSQAAFNTHIELTLNGTAIEGTLTGDGVVSNFAPPGASALGKNPKGPQSYELTHIVQQHGKAHDIVEMTFTVDDPDLFGFLLAASVSGASFAGDDCRFQRGKTPIYRCEATVVRFSISADDETTQASVTMHFTEFTPAEKQLKSSPRH